MPDVDIIIKTVNKNPRVIKDAEDDIDRLGKSAGNVASKGIGQLQHALGVGLKVAAGAAVVAIGALGVALGKSFSAAVDMEQAVADIMAVMGKAAPPVEELNKAIQGLGLDPKLKVSAFEAADAIEMLAKNGVSWQEVQDGMARSTILLANATNDDFALAADVATDAMVQFNKDASDMSDVIDGIIGVTQQSKFDINDYALALSQAGGVAGSVGVDFDDFNAMLAATSSSFASGSDAGTSFKVFLQQLIPDTNKSADAMRELGLFSGLTGTEFDKLQGKISDTQQSIAALDPTSANYGERLSELNAKLGEQRAELTKGGSAFFTAEGAMRSAEEITAALSTAFSGLSDAERISAASTIFGTDAMRTALALADAGEDTVHKFKVAIGDTSAEDAAATRMDTLSGKWEIFTGIVETNAIKLGTSFLPVAKNVTEWAIELATEHGPKVTGWFDKLGESTNGFITKLREGQPPMTAFRESFRDFIPAETMTQIDSFVGKVQTVIDWVGKTIGPFIQWDDVLGGLAIVLGATAVIAIGGFLVAIAPVAAAIGVAIIAVAAMTTSWEDWVVAMEPVSKWLKTEFPAASNASIFAANELKKAFTNLATASGESFSLTETQTKSFMTALQDTVGKGFAVMLTRMTNFVASFGDMVKIMDKAGQADWKGMWDAITSMDERYKRSLLLESAIWSGNMEAQMLLAGENTSQGFGQGVDRGNHFGVEAVRGLGEDVKGEFENSLDLNSPSGVFRGYGLNTVQGFIDGTRDMAGALGTRIGEFVATIINPFGDSINWLKQRGIDAVQGFINGIGDMIGAAQSKVTELGNLAAQALGITLESQSPSRRFRRYGEWAGQGFIDGMHSKLEQARQTAISFAQAASNAVQGVVQNVTTPAASQQAPQTTDVMQGAQRILEHWIRNGELPPANWKSMNIADNIESEVDKVTKGVRDIMYHWKNFGQEILDAHSKSLAIDDNLEGTVNALVARLKDALKGVVGAPPINPAGQPASGSGGTSASNTTALTKYLNAIREDGDWMNDWLTHMSADLKEPLKKYFGAIKEDGDWLNDWLTHLPVEFRGVVKTIGEEMANTLKASVQSALGIHSPSKYFEWVGEMSAKGFDNGYSRGMAGTPTSVNNSRADNRQFVVNVNSTGDAVRDIRNQVELYALTFGATS